MIAHVPWEYVVRAYEFAASATGSNRAAAIAPTEYNQDVLRGMTESKQVVGKVGEEAVCAKFGQHADYNLYADGDNGIDLKLTCGSVDVKTSGRLRGESALRADRRAADFYVIAFLIGTIEPGEGAYVSIVGYVDRAHVMALPVEPSRLAPYPPSVFIKWTSCAPLARLLKLEGRR